MSKPRSDAVLKTLPPERQAAIAEHLASHSLAETRAWLKADGLTTSTAALSQFLAWYSLRQQLSRNETVVETLLAELKQSNPAIAPESIEAAGQSFFTALALQQQDPKAWALAQGIAIRKKQMHLDERKLALLEKKAAQADAARKVTENGALTPEQREAEYRRIFGMS